jgi:hypothetical protein
MGITVLGQRPKCIEIIGRILMQWPTVELELALLLAALLRTQQRAAIQVFLGLRRSSPRYSAIMDAAKYGLIKRDRELCSAVIRVVQSIEKERNALAHGHFGVSDLIQDGILWADSNSNVSFLLDIQSSKASNRSKTVKKKMAEWDKSLSIYREKDLIEIETQIADTISFLNSLVEYLRLKNTPSKNKEYRKGLYKHLSNQAPIREALVLVRAEAQKSTA